MKFAVQRYAGEQLQAYCLSGEAPNYELHVCPRGQIHAAFETDRIDVIEIPCPGDRSSVESVFGHLLADCTELLDRDHGWRINGHHCSVNVDVHSCATVLIPADLNLHGSILQRANDRGLAAPFVKRSYRASRGHDLERRFVAAPGTGISGGARSRASPAVENRKARRPELLSQRSLNPIGNLSEILKVALERQVKVKGAPVAEAMDQR